MREQIAPPTPTATLSQDSREAITVRRQTQPSGAPDLLTHVDALRIEATALLPEEGRGRWGQFLTPPPVARLLASLLQCDTPAISLLDAGAGVGSLGSAAVELLCRRPERPARIHITAYEIDPLLVRYLERTRELCRRRCEAVGVGFTMTIHHADFLCESASLLENSLLTAFARSAAEPERFNCVIQNPPYRKINTDSPERAYLRRIGIETTNLYAGFLYAAMRLLAPGGELVAVTPRSFCNGKYFLPFRQAFLAEMRLCHLHAFETRDEAFKGDAVLQETLVFRAVKTRATKERPTTVTVTSGITAEREQSRRDVPYDAVVNPADPELFIHVAPGDEAEDVTARMTTLRSSLLQLGLQVSTGRVVDFRAAAYLREEPGTDTAPLIWPLHLNGANGANGAEGGGYVAWPRPGARKPGALVACPETVSLLVPNGNYVLVKRFSAKEQRRRVTAAVFEGSRLPKAAGSAGVGFENHLNYFHERGGGLPLELARGLAVYLNSTLVDAYFRLYSGHTQVNATDLKNLRYPTRPQLSALGRRVGERFPSQEEVDSLVEDELFPDGR